MRPVSCVRVVGLVCVLVLAACDSAAPPQSRSPASSQSPPLASASAPTTSAADSGARPAQSGPASRLTASYSELTPINLPMWIGKEAGLFQKRGLDVDILLIESSLGVGALLSGQVHFAAMGGSETLAAIVNGADFAVLASLSPVYPYQLQVASYIKSPQDLKGKKLGVSRFGSSSDSATRAALRRFGLKPDEDVTIVQVGSLAARTAAMLSGALDGGVAALPDTFALEAKGFHTLLDLAAERLPAVNNTLVVSRPWMAANRDTTQKFVDTTVEGIARAKKDKPLALDLMRKYLKERGEDPKALEATYDFDVGEVLQIPPVTKPEQFNDALGQLSAQVPKAKGFDVNTIIDNSFVLNAVGQGLGKVE